MKESALILLPGLLCDEVLWHDAANAIEYDISIETLIPTQQATIVEMAEWVLAQAPARFALAGFSMGGQIAMEVWARAPERVARLALMSTNPHGLTPVVKQHLANAIDSVESGGLDNYLRDAFPLYFPESAACHNPEKSRQTLQEIFLGMANRLGPAVATRQMKALLTYGGVSLDLSAVRCPTVAVCGALDARTPSSIHARMASNIPGALLHVIEGSGHFTLLEAPAVVARALDDWLMS